MNNSLVERTFGLALWLAGAGHFVILIASFQVPHRLQWKKDLASLMPFNRKLLWVQSGFTVLTIIAFGTLTLALHSETVSCRPRIAITHNGCSCSRAGFRRS